MDGFVACLVGQPGRSGAVADGIQALDIGLAVAVVFQVAAIHLDAKRLQTEVFGVGDDTDGDDTAFGFQHFRFTADLDRDFYAGSEFLDLGHLGANAELEAALFESLLSFGGDFLILNRENAIQRFNHCNVCA